MTLAQATRYCPSDTKDEPVPGFVQSSLLLDARIVA
jgi:hypothetical protein